MSANLQGACASEEEEPVSLKSWSSQTRVGKRRSKEYKGKRSTYEGIVFVPYTPGSSLRKVTSSG